MKELYLAVAEEVVMPARDASTKLRLAEYGQEDFLTVHNFGQQALSAVGSGRLLAYLYNEQDEISSRDRVISITHKYGLCAHCMLGTGPALLEFTLHSSDQKQVYIVERCFWLCLQA